jgi:hypothetical protein
MIGGSALSTGRCQRENILFFAKEFGVVGADAIIIHLVRHTGLTSLSLAIRLSLNVNIHSSLSRLVRTLTYSVSGIFEICLQTL